MRQRETSASWPSITLASLIASCGGSSSDPGIDAPVSAACLEAQTYSNLAAIEQKIFKTSCTFSGCHNGSATSAGQLDLRAQMAHASLVDVESKIDVDHKLVIPGAPASSYLLVMIGHLDPEAAAPPAIPPPSEIGLMPQGFGLLCKDKRDAIARWIANGAAND